MRFLIALFLLMMLTGVPGAKAEPMRATPYDYRNATALSRLSEASPALSETLVAQVEQVVSDLASAPVSTGEFRLFNEAVGMTTICGQAVIGGEPKRYLLQLDRSGLVYGRVNPPYAFAALAGCDRAMATWTYRP